MHGGSTPTGTANAQTHGIYARHLSESERADYAALQLGAVDDELRLTRIRLSRALAVEKAAGGKPELDEVTENDGGGEGVPTGSRKYKVRDYLSIIDKLTSRIESLEKTRAALRAECPPDNDDIDGFEVVEYGDDTQE